MSKYISRTKSKLRFKHIAESEIEQLQGDPMSNKVLADIIRRREALRNQQAQRSNERERMLQAIHNHKASAPAIAPQPKLDEFEKEYEAFIAEQRRLKAEREAKEAAKATEQSEGETAPVDKTIIVSDEPEVDVAEPVFVGWETEGETEPVKEVKDEVISEADTTSENSEEIQIVETKPKKKSKKKKVVEAVETVE